MHNAKTGFIGSNRSSQPESDKHNTHQQSIYGTNNQIPKCVLPPVFKRTGEMGIKRMD